MIGRLLGLAALVVVGSCGIEADYSNTQFRCSDTEPCPGGFSCQAGMCVSGTGTEVDAAPDIDAPMIGPDASPCGLIALSDDFEDGVRAQIWLQLKQGGTAVEETAGALLITPQAGVNQPRYAGYVSAASYNLTGRAVLVEVVQMVQTDSAAEARLLVGPSAQTSYFISQRQGMLSFGASSGGQTTVDDSIAYDSGAHRWWRIREEGGTISGETSPDGTSWTVRSSRATPGFVVNSLVEISAGTEEAVAAPGVAIFDNVNSGIPDADCP